MQHPANFDSADLPALIDDVGRRYAGASRFVQGFVRGKLRGDPATLAVLQHAAVMRFGAVTDLGSGRGQLGLALLAARLADSVAGFDLDAAKLADATRAATDLPARYAVADLATAAVPDCDTVLLIDVLLQMQEVAQRALLGRVVAAARRQVLIRAFDPDRGWRTAVGRGMERAGCRIRGDGSVLCPLPLATLAAPFEAAGFMVSVAPCWGRTPLPNVLLVARRDRP